MVRPAFPRLSLDSGAVQGVVYNTLSIPRQLHRNNMYDYTYQFIH